MASLAFFVNICKGNIIIGVKSGYIRLFDKKIKLDVKSLERNRSN